MVNYFQAIPLGFKNHFATVLDFVLQEYDIFYLRKN